MFCDNCGCEIGSGVKICPVCGKNLEGMMQDTGMMEDISVKTEDTQKEASDMEKVLLDASKKDNADVINTDDLEEEGTTVLKTLDLDKEAAAAETPDEEGTTVLNTDMLNGANGIPPYQNNRPMPGQPGPNGVPPYQNRPMPGQPGPNGMPPYQNNRPMPGQPGPNGMPPYQNRPMPGQPGLNGMPVNNEEDKKKKKEKKQKPPKQPKASKQPKTPKQPKAPKEKKGKGGKIALIVSLILVVLAAGGAAAVFVPKFLNYNKAEEALKDGKIDEALSLYNKAKPIKDSKDMTNGGAYYEYAEKLEEAGNYLEAAENYRKAAGLNYEDAAEAEKECYFNQAEKLYAEENYTEAAEYYEKAGDVNGAADKVKECSYMNGSKLLESGLYDEAAQAFATAGNYQNAADKVKECYYQSASEKMDAGDYVNAKDLFLKSEYSDYSDKANECLCLLAKQYIAQENYSKAIEIYGQVDSAYKDVSEDIDNVRIEWAERLEENNDYKNAVEMYLQVTTKNVSKKINQAKASYIENHFDSNDETTMDYLCDLKYADYGSAKDDYEKLVGWSIESFVNDELENYKDKNNSASSSKTIYVHTMYLNENEFTLSLKGYIIYSDGTKSNEITFGEIKNSYTTWLSIDSVSAIKGDATLYIYNTDKNTLIEKYTFTIK